VQPHPEAWLRNACAFDLGCRQGAPKSLIIPCESTLVFAKGKMWTISGRDARCAALRRLPTLAAQSLSYMHATRMLIHLQAFTLRAHLGNKKARFPQKADGAG